MREVEGGFPHSEIRGSKLVRSSPRLIAAYHVLHRLSAPRHPPDTLKALDRSHEQCPLPIPARRGGPKATDGRPVHCQKDQFLACRTHPVVLRSSWTALQPMGPGIGVIHVRTCSLSTMSNNPRIQEPFDPRTAIHDEPNRPRKAPRRQSLVWWSQTGSNRRPHACKARALPTELWPHSSGPQSGLVRAEGRGGRSALRTFGSDYQTRAPDHGGPGTTRTSDLTLIRGAL